MKKLFALLLVFVMLFSFVGCGEEKDVRGDQIDNTASETESEVEFSMGAVDGLVYENEFIGIGCKLDSDWTFYTDAQIRELNNITEDMAGEAYEEAIGNADIVYDMYAVSSNQTDNINVNLEKVNPVQLATLNIKENFEASSSLVKDSLENMGCTNVQFEYSDITIDGKKFDCMSISSEINGLTMYQTSIGIKCNGYLASITATAFSETDLNNILSKLYLV